MAVNDLWGDTATQHMLQFLILTTLSWENRAKCWSKGTSKNG